MPIWGKASTLGYLGYVASDAYPGTYLHELGHKTAINALFDGAHPTIEVKPFHGGGTRWSSAAQLNDLGHALGYDASRATVAAAGPAVDLFSSMASFAVGHSIRKEHPALGGALMGYAGFRVARDIVYALTPCAGDACRGNDFQNLARFAGLPPWAAAAIFALALPAEALLLKKLEKSQPN